MAGMLGVSGGSECEPEAQAFPAPPAWLSGVLGRGQDPTGGQELGGVQGVMADVPPPPPPPPCVHGP